MKILIVIPCYNKEEVLDVEKEDINEIITENKKEEKKNG